MTKNSHLPVHEWCIIVLFCLILLALAGFALGRSKKGEDPIHSPLAEMPVALLEIKVEGAVVKPGVYRMPLSASLKDVLDQAELLPSADQSKLKWNRKLRHEQTIRIPERTWITIYIEGAVTQPGSLQILSGTRGQELADQLDVLPEADLKALRKKRQFLQQGDTITIPIKKKRKSNQSMS